MEQRPPEIPKINIYDWPKFSRSSSLDREFADWAEAVQVEMQHIFRSLSKPLPDDPVQLDEIVTREIDGWLPRVAALAVQAEFYLSQAKLEKLPPKARTADGKPLVTEAEREAEQEAGLGQYRFVRNLLDAYVQSMRDRVRWAQSVRKGHGESNIGF